MVRPLTLHDRHVTIFHVSLHLRHSASSSASALTQLPSPPHPHRPGPRPGIAIATCSVAVAPPSPITTTALCLALPSADDPFLLAVASCDGSLHAADMRVPGRQLAVLRGVHEGPVWAMAPAIAHVHGTGSSSSSSSGRGASGSDAAAATAVPVLLSAGEDGALHATPLAALRGLGSGMGVTVPPAGAAGVAGPGQLPFDLSSPGLPASAPVTAATLSSAFPDSADSYGLGWTVLRGGYPLRSLSASAGRSGAGSTGSLVAAGDSSGRILASRLVLRPEQRR